MNTEIPTKFKPQVVGDFVGPAHRIAVHIAGMAMLALKSRDPACILLFGEPGVCKSQLARFAMDQFQVPKFNQSKMTGLDISVDYVREMCNQMQYVDMAFRGYWMDEIDTMKRDAQVRWLTMSDDVPPGNLIVATCNSHIDQLEPRFVRRFQTFEVVGPTADEIIPLLSRWLTTAEAGNLARMHAADAGGGYDPKKRLNAGAILADVKTILEKKQMKAYEQNQSVLA